MSETNIEIVDKIHKCGKCRYTYTNTDSLKYHIHIYKHKDASIWY